MTPEQADEITRLADLLIQGNSCWSCGNCERCWAIWATKPLSLVEWMRTKIAERTPPDPTTGPEGVSR